MQSRTRIGYLGGFLCLLLLSSGAFGNGRYAPDQILVRLKAPHSIRVSKLTPSSYTTAKPAVENIARTLEAKTIKPLYPAGAMRPLRALSLKSAQSYQVEKNKVDRTVVVTLPDHISVEEALEMMRQHEDVELCEPNYYMWFSRAPNDPFYSTQWHHNNSGQTGGLDGFDPPGSGTVGRDVDAERAWDTLTGSNSVIVAIIDSGVDWDHPDLETNIWSNPNETASNSIDDIDDDGNGFVDDIRGWDFGSNDNDPDDTCLVPGHGTHVAGIVAAIGNNGIGVSGIGWGLTLMPIKVADGNCGILTSNVATALLYATDNGAHIANMSLGGEAAATLEAAVNTAVIAGVTVISAAGNETTSDPTGSFPSAYSNVIGVAATDRNDQKASFSNYGSMVSLSAPGVAIRSTIPNGLYDYFSGTSMAAPLTAGIAGLVLSQYPSLTVAEVTQRLLDSAENIDALNPSFSGQLGTGRINVARALMSVTGISPATGASDTTVTVALSGISFVPNMSVQLTRSGETTINATNVVFNSASSLSCDLTLSAAATGQWNVVVGIGQTSQTLSNGFNIDTISVESLNPSSSTNAGSTGVVTLTGTNFVAGMTVALRRSGQTDIQGTGVTVNSLTSATVTFDVTNAEGGRRNVLVSNGNTTNILIDGFLITSDDFKVVTVDQTQSNVTILNPPPSQETQTVTLPLGSVSQSTTLDMDATPTLPALNTSVDPFRATNIGLEIISSITNLVFNSPITITLSYRLADLPDPNREDALTIAFFNTTTSRWESLDSTVEPVARTVTAQSDHLTVFAIVQQTPSTAGLNQVVAYPNPFRSDNKSHTVVTFNFLTAGAQVRIFDLAGALIQDLIDSNNDGKVDWKVDNKSGEKVASGIYIYMVTDPGGNKKVGRVGVIK